MGRSVDAAKTTVRVEQVIAWAAGLTVACAAFTAFAFQTFETKPSASEREARTEQRLDRIENKIDRLIDHELKGK